MAAADQETHVSEVRPRSYQDDSYRKWFLGTVGDLQKAGVLQDVVIEVEDRRFPCHRLVLSAASPYFRAMFTSGMAESRQETVVLQGLDADMFKEILSYIYTGTVHVSLDKVQPLYQAADLLQLDYVRNTCSSYMVMNLASSTCVDLYNFADVFSLYIVLHRCRQWIRRHFAKFVSSEEFCRLSVNQLTKIISHDKLDVKEEMTVWEAVVRWVQHSREDRLHHLPSILPHIRFNLLTSDDKAAILDHPLVREHPGRTFIRHLAKKTSNLPRRVGMDSLEMALVFCTSSNEILYMNPRAGKYISCSYDCKSLRTAEAITVTSNNDIYVLAEKPKDCNRLHVLEYNHAGNKWERARPPSVCMPKENNCLGIKNYLVEVDGILYYLYVLSTESSGLVLIRKYNWHTDQWQECSQLQLREANIEYMTTLSCGPHIYFLQNTEMHRYNPDQDRWSKLTPPRGMPYLCTAAALGAEIFCAGHEFSKAMVYHTESDCWQILRGWRNTGNSNICYTPNFFVLENQLYLLLERLNTALDTEEDSLIFVYDRVADAWSSRGLKDTLPFKESLPRTQDPKPATSTPAKLGSNRDPTIMSKPNTPPSAPGTLEPNPTPKPTTPPGTLHPNRTPKPINSPSNPDPNPMSKSTTSPSNPDLNPMLKPTVLQSIRDPNPTYNYKPSQPTSYQREAENVRNPNPTYPQTTPMDQPDFHPDSALDSAGQNPLIVDSHLHDGKSANNKGDPLTQHSVAARLIDDETATATATSDGNAGSHPHHSSAVPLSLSPADSNDGNPCHQPHAVPHLKPDMTASAKHDAGACLPPNNTASQSRDEASMRRSDSDDSLSIQPYAVRYQEEEEDGNSMRAADYTLTGNTPFVPPTPPDDDGDIEPYAVAYMGQGDTIFVKKCTDGSNTSTRNRNDISASLEGGDSAITGANASASAGIDARHEASLNPNPMYWQNALNPNPMYQPNAGQQRSCGTGFLACMHACYGLCRRHAGKIIFMVVLLVCFTFAGLYFSGRVQVGHKLTSATDNISIPDHSAPDTPYTPGLPTRYITEGSTGDSVTSTSSTNSSSSVQTTPTLPSYSNETNGGRADPVVFGGGGSEPGKFTRNYGVAVSADNEIFVTDLGNQRVQVFSMEGTYLRLFPTVLPAGKGQKIEPYDVAMDGKGHVWAVGYREKTQHVLHAVQYSKNGLPTTTRTFDVQHRTRYPSIAVDLRNNNIIVVSSTQIFILQPTGSVYRRFGAAGRLKAEFSYVTTDQASNIVVVDTAQSTVHVYDPSGRHRVTFGGYGQGEGKLLVPRGICVNKTGHIFVADWLKHKLERLEMASNQITNIVPNSFLNLPQLQSQMPSTTTPISQSDRTSSAVAIKPTLSTPYGVPITVRFTKIKNETLFWGDTLHLVCEASGISSAKMTIILPSGLNANAETSGRVTVEANDTLTTAITDVTEADAGMYTCVALGPVGFMSATLTVDIRSPTSVSPQFASPASFPPDQTEGNADTLVFSLKVGSSTFGVVMIIFGIISSLFLRRKRKPSLTSASSDISNNMSTTIKRTHGQDHVYDNDNETGTIEQANIYGNDEGAGTKEQAQIHVYDNDEDSVSVGFEAEGHVFENGYDTPQAVNQSGAEAAVSSLVNHVYGDEALNSGQFIHGAEAAQNISSQSYEEAVSVASPAIYHNNGKQAKSAAAHILYGKDYGRAEDVTPQLVHDNNDI
uniref:BTB domain-containing protein n=1 Tax=Branchiostoma floridae TaxID=7739 RepID=C3XXN8_BRAFL|eukprot:XP_002611488.1 hypothetical protein BRAFLDRAFT_63877 [Branchiostoma floridae]